MHFGATTELTPTGQYHCKRGDSQNGKQNKLRAKHGSATTRLRVSHDKNVFHVDPSMETKYGTIFVSVIQTTPGSHSCRYKAASQR